MSSKIHLYPWITYNTFLQDFVYTNTQGNEYWFESLILNGMPAILSQVILMLPQAQVIMISIVHKTRAVNSIRLIDQLIINPEVSTWVEIDQILIDPLPFSPEFSLFPL